MSGIAGIVSSNRCLDFELGNINLMTDAMRSRGRNAFKIKNSKFAVFGCASSVFCDDEEKQIPCSLKNDGVEYVICFDGLIYNSSEIRHEIEKRYNCSEKMGDPELVLRSFLRWGAGCLTRLNGIFAFSIWNSKTNELFLARDRFGIKPLYFTVKNGCIIFASQIKGILANKNVDAVIDKTGLCEVLGLGPAQTQGCGTFKGINEIKPAHFALYNKTGLTTHRYWQLESKAFSGDFDECLETTRKLTFDAIGSQIEDKGRNVAFFLSGGVDSSAIVALASRTLGKKLDTFSLKYNRNDEYFTPTEYQPASDDYFIDLVREDCNTNHHVITVDTYDLVEHLTDAVDARDLPGMADVDSSLYFLCKEMGKDFSGAVSGECADEVFGGYPWFHRKEDFDTKVFPWAKNIDLRRNLVSPDALSPDEIEEYIYRKYNESIKETPICFSDTPEEKRRREIAHLNLNWFMYTLGARSERIGMNNGLEIRMPFCDHKLVEYVWNIPWEFKAYKGREKGLLRTVFDRLLPEEVLWRKKSPFPKTHNPEYEEIVKAKVRGIFNDKNSPIHGIINEKFILELMDMPSDYGKPWFGQLMAIPQLYAYIIQFDYWLKKYNIKLSI
ncbi:MAG: asparagine synthase (glutamine-hydrolyzing) [Clostridia bacterium]|nr:asparagine synthase (glutamine-hydrolyzing) [Clostridia bacterium]